MNRLKAVAFTLACLAVAVAPSLLLGYFAPVSDWRNALLRAVLSLAWGYAVGKGFAWYVLRNLRKSKP